MNNGIALALQQIEHNLNVPFVFKSPRKQWRTKQVQITADLHQINGVPLKGFLLSVDCVYDNKIGYEVSMRAEEYGVVLENFEGLREGEMIQLSPEEVFHAEAQAVRELLGDSLASPDSESTICVANEDSAT